MASAGSSLLCEQIVDSFRSLVGSTGFNEQIAREQMLPEDLIVVNNSFIERQSIKVKSAKNAQYLCVNRDQLDDVGADVLGVCTPSSFNADFKRYNARSSNLPRRLSLSEAVTQNLSGVGKLVFLLVGAVNDNIEVSVPLKSPPFSQLRFVPTNEMLVTLCEDVIEVNEVRDPNALWNALQVVLLDENAADEEIPSDLASKFAQALPLLRAQVHSVIELPEGELEVCEGTLMRRMIDSLRNEITAYETAIARCDGDPMRDSQSFADVLRIAYNFASDSQKLITLLVSVCDLKPLLLWATIAEHFRLSHSFKRLPWARDTKASPGEFYNTVSGARNHAFHDLIRIDRAIQVQVESVSLQARSLTLFAPYTKKLGNTLTYEDQELVQALTQFTHAPESAVAPDFWRQTSQVMRALADLLVAMDRALILLHNECTRSGMT